MVPTILTALVLTLPQGRFDGKAVCTGPGGERLEYRQTLAVAGDTVTTTIHGDGGAADEVFVKTAKPAGSGGFFTWSGPAVVKGSGYCTSSGVCHWDMVMHDPGLGDLPGEDTAFVADGRLHVVGSVVGDGKSYVCEEVYGLETGAGVRDGRRPSL